MYIKKITAQYIKELTEVAIASFLPAHGHSSPKEDMDTYIAKHFNPASLAQEISDTTNEYYGLWNQNKMIGYFKINFNQKTAFCQAQNITYMSRLYLLQQYYDLGLGEIMLNKAIDLSKSNNQQGMWLKVWKENKRAIKFYEKRGFQIIGESDYKISSNHSNPNFVMYKTFDF